MSDKDASGLVERLHRAVTTASNDDLSEPMTEKRSRHVERITAMSEAADLITSQAEEIERLREALKPLAALNPPKRHAEGNSGFYSIRFADIKAARTALNGAQP